MNRRFPPIAVRSGTTLIEVLAGLVILSTLLVSLAIARGRFLRQWAQADHRIAASKETNDLLQTWLSGSPDSVPTSSTGVTDDGKNVWSTQIIPSPAAASVGAIVISLRVYEQSTDQPPLCQVDFLLRKPHPGPRSQNRGGT